jgi:hypothetical protein
MKHKKVETTENSTYILQIYLKKGTEMPKNGQILILCGASETHIL